MARESDVVILCMGLDETLEGEEGDTGNSYASGDKVDLRLPESQRMLMQAVAKEKKPTVLCLMAGSDIDLSFAEEHFDAIVDLWYPGAYGGAAAADILFGKYSPSGKLPITFYESLEELPAFEDYSMKGRTYRYLEQNAQYPFGYGLTYTKMKIRNVWLETADREMENGESESEDLKAEVLVCAEVENCGNMDSQEVLQIYVRDTESEYETPHPHLAGPLFLGFGPRPDPPDPSVPVCYRLRRPAGPGAGQEPTEIPLCPRAGKRLCIPHRGGRAGIHRGGGGAAPVLPADHAGVLAGTPRTGQIRSTDHRGHYHPAGGPSFPERGRGHQSDPQYRNLPPFFSYGGTALMIQLAEMGMVLSISR